MLVIALRLSYMMTLLTCFLISVTLFQPVSVNAVGTGNIVATSIYVATIFPVPTAFTLTG